MERLKLSVCIPSTPRRMRDLLPRVIDQLDRQATKYVEVICILDNECISIGEKINLMWEMSRGRFVSIVADDDMVSGDYAEQLCAAIDEAPDADVIVFDCAYYVGGDFTATIKEGKGFPETTVPDEAVFLRKPSEKMCWRRDFVLEHPHIDSWETNDIEFARRVEKSIRKEHRIDKTLYHFYYEPDKRDSAHYRKELDFKYGKPRRERGFVKGR